MMKRLLFLLIAMSFGVASFAQTQPKSESAGVKIYNPLANAQADIDAAAAKAKKENKHVFVQVGGNWCIWCIRFHNLVEETPELKNYLNNNFETVLVNYSPENKNEAVLKKLKNPGRFGFPVFLILDGNGEVLHIQNSAYLEEGKGHSVKLITDFLKNWTYTAVNPSLAK
ncbi:MAG: thioredoxin family protein [Pedobacter sp.]|uniref:thioredoxin family protein n=1 Tax=Pedobacter sp. TaxID=1411316 RepID=UPI002806E13E|nr:thioredoxin family protein [Pedobacter sp.]MDQ8003909.1 thioredoxin family protein [Pedobacter sp.]